MKVKVLVRFSSKEREYLESQMVGRLATSSETGVPHVAPVCYASNPERVYIHTGRNSKKMRNILKNNRVAFVADDYVDWGKFRAVVIQGVAEVLERGKEYETGRTLIYSKYPRWEKEYPIVEGGEALIVIAPQKTLSWGLE